MSSSQFAVGTSITEQDISKWFTEIINVCKVYAESVEGKVVFAGDSSRRITQRGMPSAQTRTSTAISKTAPRFITISKEAKTFILSLLSIAYTEIVASVGYIHHRAFELNDLSVSTKELIEKIEMKISRNDRANKQIVRNQQKESEDPLVVEGRKHMIEYEEKLFRERLDAWYKGFRLWSARNPEASGCLTTEIEDLASATQTKDLYRLQRLVEQIRDKFIGISNFHSRNEPVYVTTAQNVILCKQYDFQYPFGASWFELMHKAHELGLGRERLEVACRGHSTTVTAMYEAIKKDIREQVLPAIKSLDPRMGSLVIVNNSFIDEVASVIVDFMVYLSIQMYSYVAAGTDSATATTIQYRAINIILQQFPTNNISPLSPGQCDFISTMFIRAVTMAANK